ncbi:GLPGLI family protein [uncultured Winogradskyella sp.]|uniref:GLPGLI family protein n=1 Tax=uncultured Winogradskyella sp. TaxID=395353 RepID=UPI0030D735B5|tara:strand:+ start:5692 stop:6546 length:855 start_codon:yes stop_codon:yes gene_type:complete
MTTVIRIIVLALTVVFSSVNAQDFQGVATYKTQRKIDIKMDSTQMNSEMHTKMMEMMKKQFQKTFQLTFNKEASLYKEDVALDKPQAAMRGEFQIVMVGNGGGSDVLYKNTKDNRYADQKDTMGKIFLVKDEFKKIDWKLEAETKYIGEYQCYKATYTKQVEVFNNTGFSMDSDDKKEDKKPVMEERTVTAWYTPQIPVNNGPAMYQGLPGLILEVHDGKLTIICSKIVLNPEDRVKIEEPIKGKEVNQEKYDEIMDKKNKEMMERYAPRKGRKGEGISITIGG